jgi:hypothetical protein
MFNVKKMSRYIALSMTLDWENKNLQLKSLRLKSVIDILITSLE